MNYSYFPTYFPDSRPFFPTSHRIYEPSFDHEQPQEYCNDYTFLPAKQNFFDTYSGSPLNVSRLPTDTTDTSEQMSNSRRCLSPTLTPFKKTGVQEIAYNITANFAPKEIQLQNPKNKFTAVLGSSTGISFSIFKHDQEKQQALTQTHLIQNNFQSSYLNKSERTQVKDENGDEDGIQNHDSAVNAQLKNLLEAKIWNDEKDHNLLKLGTQYKCDWKKIARRFAHKKITPHFLKIRFKELTCAPLQRRIKFNHKEDLMIAKYFDKYGSNWAQMATHFRERTAIMLKNRYYSFIRKRELLDYLLEEVRELEKTNNIPVEDIQDMDPELYTDPYAGKKDLSKNDSGNSCDEDNSQAEESVSKHHIFGYETSHGSGFMHTNSYKEDEDDKIFVETEESDHNNYGDNTDKGSEILRLQAKVRSMESEYLKAKAELDQIKGVKNF